MPSLVGSEMCIRDRKISGGELPRAEEEASDRMSIETSSISLLAHLDQHAQPYIYQSVIYPSRPERVPRSEERASGRGTNEPSGRRVSGGGKNQPRYIHQMNRHYRAEIKPRVEYYLVQRKMRAVMLSNNPSRPERAAVHLSMNHSSISVSYTHLTLPKICSV